MIETKIFPESFTQKRIDWPFDWSVWPLSTSRTARSILMSSQNNDSTNREIFINQLYEWFEDFYWICFQGFRHESDFVLNNRTDITSKVQAFHFTQKYFVLYVMQCRWWSNWPINNANQLRFKWSALRKSWSNT